MYDEMVGDMKPTRTWECGTCGGVVERYRGESDVTCVSCDTEYNAFGQRLRTDWRGNASNWNEDVGDMEGFERQRLACEREW